MDYLEVKYIEEDEIKIDTNNFISNVINSQNNLGNKKIQNQFCEKELIDLGFIKNSSTKGYSISKNLSLEEIKKLAFEIDKLENHILTHGYIYIKVYKGKVYFWDTALIYEGMDTFEYCFKYHNKFTIGELNVITKSNSINEELLNLANYTKRYSEPSLDFITQGYVWDKKEGKKVLKIFVPNINEYISKDSAIAY